MDKLHEYARRRDFGHTPEPPPRADHEATGPLRFVVQAHAARNLHYDFRLQMGNVLVSWAVPKGPSLNPRDRRLAVLTEDHPLEYAHFEGIIPKGAYGGGSVIVWDEGTWQPQGDPREGFESGKLRFTLHGKKLRGRFHLTRTRLRSNKSQAGDDGSSWLLIKGRDASAREGEQSIVEQAPASVLSGLTVAQVADSPAATWRPKVAAEAASPSLTLYEVSSLASAKKSTFPTQHAPQLATLVSEPPSGDEYLHEAKFDGYRLIAEVRSRSVNSSPSEPEVRLWTRGDQDWSQRLPSLTSYLSTLPLGDVLLDGELVFLDERGLSNFQLLQNALGSKNKPAQDGKLLYVVFDLIHQDGYNLSQVAQKERKTALASLLVASGADPQKVRLSEHVVGKGPEFFAQACKLGMEGIISKRMDAPYRARRSQAWLKCKCLRRQEFVIGGFTDPSGSRAGLGALLVGHHDEHGKLKYAGKVGTGFSEQSLSQLFERLSSLACKASPFIDPPKGAQAKAVHWVRPELLAEVTFSEMTSGGKLRHPSFQGLREDRKAERVVLERPLDNGVSQPTPRAKAGKMSPTNQASPPLPIQLTHPERILYPEQGVTKQALAEYYMRAADWILPHVKDRLLTLVRCPAGQGKHCFYQKHAKQGLPKNVLSHAHDEEGAEQFVYVRDAAGLVALVQVGVLEIHPWGSRTNNLDLPDQLVFDLDPDPDLDWVRLVEGALDVKDELKKFGLKSFVKTTGGKGLHVTAPLSPSASWPEAKSFCRSIAEKLASEHPNRYVATMAKSKRTGKIFIDYLRNARGATAVAPYSTRALPDAPVATPIAWEELARDVRSEFRLLNLPGRLEALPIDPWEGFFDLTQTISSRTTSPL